MSEMLELKVIRDKKALCFEDKLITPEFVVLHYTAQSLEKSLEILTSPVSQVSAHLVISEEGELYELVPCLSGLCKKAFHAGKSHFYEGLKKWKNFNDFSIGIELVSLNGNFFEFKEGQYEALFEVLKFLKKTYPALENPKRILGHEQIASFRGKKDPGLLFDWESLFKTLYPLEPVPERKASFKKEQVEALKFLKKRTWSDERAKRVSLVLEKNWPFFFKKLYLYLFS